MPKNQRNVAHTLRIARVVGVFGVLISGAEGERRPLLHKTSHACAEPSLIPRVIIPTISCTYVRNVIFITLRLAYRCLQRRFAIPSVLGAACAGPARHGYGVVAGVGRDGIIRLGLGGSARPDCAANRRTAPTLENRLSQALGVPVRIGAITAQSYSLVPSFEMQDVRLLDSAGDDALVLKKVTAALSPRSLLNLGFDQLVIEQPELDIRRTAQGKILVAGWTCPARPPMRPSPAAQRIGFFHSVSSSFAPAPCDGRMNCAAQRRWR